jgi:ethanolaminephosphotransferase
MAVPALLPPALLARADALLARRDALLAAKKRALLARAAALREQYAVHVRRAAAARRRLAAAAGRYYRPQFSDEQLRALTAYKNKGADHSVTYKYVMAPLYDRLVRLVPRGVAPNAVTLVGFVLIIVSHLVLMWFSPKLEEAAPGWVYVFVGVSLATYMVLDNLDGRQARRTGSSSPLGHLFDHGCDAFNVTISGVSFIAMLQLGPGVVSYAMLFFVGHLICFAASLEELFTGAMVLREINGPNEGLIIMSSFHIITGLLGPAIWRAPATLLGVTMQRNRWVGIAMGAPASVTVIGNVAAIVWDARRRGTPPATALRRVASASANFTLYGGSLFAWATLAPRSFADAVLPVLWLSCVNFFYMISRMIICHLTATVYPPVLRATLPQALCALNAVAGSLLRGAPLVPQAPLIAVTLAWTTAFNAWRIYCMILQICDYLNIRCLHLGPLRPPTADGTPDWDEDGFHGNHHLVHEAPAPAVFCAALNLPSPLSVARKRAGAAAPAAVAT